MGTPSILCNLQGIAVLGLTLETASVEVVYRVRALDCLERLLHRIEKHTAELLYVLLLHELRNVPLEALGERQSIAEESVVSELHLSKEPLQLVRNRVFLATMLLRVVAKERRVKSYRSKESLPPEIQGVAKLRRHEECLE